ncbi:MAG TPA: class II fructose-bisphosphate aldolase [Flexilinea sp.]|nr:class II fructose-bisphosphate aldolase [Flexilinea sp.]HPS48062.1 class II fructose-bisphosphate aldolase [Flexilinea sp.]
MPLISSFKILSDAQKGHYAIGAFNIENMEMAQAVIAAGEETNSPLIIQTTPSTLKYAPPSLFYAIVKSIADNSKIPVALHLDHGDSFARSCEAIRAGYTSIMIDGSKLPFEENIALTKKVVEVASILNIPVEGELGTIGGKEDSLEVKDKDALYTNVDQAVEFVDRTGCSFLAVAIGTAHGFYKGTPKLDFERIEQIAKRVSVPLVLHGGSGIPDEDVKHAIRLGMSKVNFATELRWYFTQACRKVLEDGEIFDPKKYGAAGRDAVRDFVKQKIMVCGSDGKV